MDNNWDYEHYRRVFGIDRNDYFIGIDDGTWDDVLHPTARYTSIGKTWANDHREFGTTIPILDVQGSRLGFLGTVRKFHVGISAGSKGKKPAVNEVSKAEQERRLNALLEYLTSRGK
jgi:hypothetical protein